MSTEAIAAKTFIPLRLLKALEEGQLDQLPEPVFIQGFIRRYADALNLDGAALAQTFSITTVLPVESDTSTQEVARVPSRSLSLQSYKPYILVVLGVTVAGGLLYLLSKVLTAKPQLQPNNTSVTQQQQALTGPKPSASATPKASSSDAPVKVTVILEDESWLRVIADQTPRFEGVLPKGTRKTWSAKRQLTIRAGNAGAVLVSFNRQKPKPLGNAGDVQEVTFTPNKQ
jgi:cytoskeletal protein RodZ